MTAAATLPPACGGAVGEEVAPDGGTDISPIVVVDAADERPATDGGADAPDPVEVPRPFVPFDLNHVLSTGQSLAVGVKGAPPLSLDQPFGNLMFESGVLAGELDDAGASVLEGGLGSLVPLLEGDVPPNTTLPVETMSSGLANLVSTFLPGHDVVVSVHGAGATPYRGLAKGSPPYALGLAQVTAARALAQARGASYVVRAVTVVHGESDHEQGNTGYAGDLVRWQADYEADVKGITGQSEPVPLLESQMSSYAPSAIPQAQLDAHVTAHGKVVLVGPKYHLPYADGLHLTNEGYRHMGEDYAKVYRRVVLQGRTWEPLRPRTIARVAEVITVRFFVPAPPLAIDTALVAEAPSLGFAYADGSAAPPAIVDVAIASADTVRVRLSRAPNGPGRLTYAKAPPRGNLRDSDATPSRSGYPLFNWCVHFDVAVP